MLVVDGNVVRAKPLIGRPCFGIPTALLRYEHATRYVKGRGQLPTGRCNGCKAKDACRWVVDNRLRSTPAIKAAWTEWLQGGGPNSFSSSGFKDTHVRQLWFRLCRELRAHPFASANDQNVIEAYVEKDRLERERDKMRKALARRVARKAGVIDEIDLKLLNEARTRRAVTLIDAIKNGPRPKEIGRVPGKSLVEMLDVWLAREDLRARGIRPTLGKIACWIKDNGKRNESATEAALQTRVSRDLGRIKKLEKVRWGNGVLLPPLDKNTEFPSDTPRPADQEMTP